MMRATGTSMSSHSRPDFCPISASQDTGLKLQTSPKKHLLRAALPHCTVAHLLRAVTGNDAHSRHQELAHPMLNSAGEFQPPQLISLPGIGF
jgi:hypothetical protein